MLKNEREPSSDDGSAVMVSRPFVAQIDNQREGARVRQVAYRSDTVTVQSVRFDPEGRVVAQFERVSAKSGKPTISSIDQT
jgi:hypothetical protein